MINGYVVMDKDFFDMVVNAAVGGINHFNYPNANNIVKSYFELNKPMLASYSLSEETLIVKSFFTINQIVRTHVSNGFLYNFTFDMHIIDTSVVNVEVRPDDVIYITVGGLDDGV